MQPEPVPIGTTTKAGYGVGLIALVVAIIAYINGDHSADNATVIATAVVAGGSFAITQIGRYLQAVAIAKAPGLIGQELTEAIIHELDNADARNDRGAPTIAKSKVVKTHGDLDDEDGGS